MKILNDESRREYDKPDVIAQHLHDSSQLKNSEPEFPHMRLPSDDLVQHDVKFSHRWVDRLQSAVEGRMHTLGADGGRIHVDSGVLDLDLFKADYDKQTSRLRASGRLRSRIDAIIMHEYCEYFEKTHAGSIANARKTEHPISKKTRNLTNAMYSGPVRPRSRYAIRPPDL